MTDTPPGRHRAADDPLPPEQARPRKASPREPDVAGEADPPSTTRRMYPAARDVDSAPGSAVVPAPPRRLGVADETHGPAATRRMVPAPPPRPSTARQSVPPMAALQSVSRPAVVAVGFWLWVAASVLVAVPVVLASMRIDPMRVEFARLARASDPAATDAAVDRVAGVSVLIVVGTGAALGLLGLLLSGAMRSGRGWARFLLTLVAAVALVYAAFVTTAVTGVMLGDLRPLVSSGLLAYAAVVLVATVCMFAPGTKVWFHRPKGSP